MCIRGVTGAERVQLCEYDYVTKFQIQFANGRPEALISFAQYLHCNRKWFGLHTIDAVARHGGDLAELLQELDDVALVRGLHAREQTHAAHHLQLLLVRELVELAPYAEHENR